MLILALPLDLIEAFIVLTCVSLREWIIGLPLMLLVQPLS